MGLALLDPDCYTGAVNISGGNVSCMAGVGQGIEGLISRLALTHGVWPHVVDQAPAQRGGGHGL